MLPIEPPISKDRLAALDEALANCTGRAVISIDGAPGSRKTTLGRYLSWRLELVLVETDLFLVPERGALIYRLHDLRAYLDLLHERKRGYIIEGAVVLRLLEELAVGSDFHLHVDDGFSADEIREMLVVAGSGEGRSIQSDFADYLEEFGPKDRANLVISKASDSSVE